MAVLRNIKLDTIKSAIALTMSDEDTARDWARQRWGVANAPEHVTKAAVSSTISSDVDTTASVLEDRAFFGLVAERAVLPRLRGIRRSGFRVRTVTTSGATAVFLGEGKAIPTFRPQFSNTGLLPKKVAAMTIATEAALNEASGIEATIHADLTAAFIDAMDGALLAPGNAGNAVTPASITNGVSPVIASSDPAEDFEALVDNLGGDPGAAYVIMSPVSATRLAGHQIGREVGARGGEIAGIPVITSRRCPRDLVVLVDPGGLIADWEDVVHIEASRHGTVKMDTEPTMTADSPTETTTLSLWQSNCVGFRAVGRVAWQRVRAGSVAVLQGGTGSWLF